MIKRFVNQSKIVNQENIIVIWWLCCMRIGNSQKKKTKEKLKNKQIESVGKSMIISHDKTPKPLKSKKMLM